MDKDAFQYRTICDSTLKENIKDLLVKRTYFNSNIALQHATCST